MKKIMTYMLKDGKIILDFDESMGKDCARLRDKILARLKTMGIETEIESQSFKEGGANGTRGNQRISE